MDFTPIYRGTEIKVVLQLIGRGIPTIVRSTDFLFEPDENDFLVGPMFTLSQGAVAGGTISTPVLGVYGFRGQGQIGQGIGTEVSSCDGACVEEET